MTNGGIKFCQLTTGINLPTAKSDNLSLSVFPNPENDELNVQFNAKSAAKALLEIYDVQGRIIKAFAEKPVIGSNKFTLNISELRNGSGIFVLRLIQDEVSYNQSFILNR